MPFTHVGTVRKYMSTSLIILNPDIKVKLWHPHRMGVWTVKVEALVMLVTVAICGKDL